MKPWRGLLACLASAAVLAGCFRAPAPGPDRPDILLIVMDTLRADRIGAQRNGQPVMPFVSALAAQGDYFSGAISPSSWTRPAMASLFTGVYPARHGVHHSARVEDPHNPTSDRLADSWETLAEWLASAGYTNWAFQTNANLSAALGFAQGFPEGHYIFGNGVEGDTVTAHAVEALPNLPSPWFIYAHYMDVHAPYAPPEALEDALGPSPELSPEETALLENSDRFMEFYLDQVKTAIGLQQTHQLPDLSEAGREAVRHRYDLECLSLDRAVANLVHAARERNPETVIILVSDHGEEFWERGGMGHGVTLMEEQLRVPLIIVDGARTGATHPSPVSSMTILPWLAKRLEIPPPAQWDFATFPGIHSQTRGPWPALKVDQTAAFSESAGYIRDHNRVVDTGLDLTVARWRVIGPMPAPEPFAAWLNGYAALSAPSASAPLNDADREALESMGYLERGAP